MARCRLSDKKVKQLEKKTKLSIRSAYVRGNTDHRIDLLLEDGSIMCLSKQGVLEKSIFIWKDKEIL